MVSDLRLMYWDSQIVNFAVLFLMKRLKDDRSNYIPHSALKNHKMGYMN